VAIDFAALGPGFNPHRRSGRLVDVDTPQDAIAATKRFLAQEPR